MSKRKKTSLVVKLVILLAVIWFLNYILYMSRTSKMKLIEESKNLLKLEFAKKIMRPVYDVNCRQIFELNKNETQKAKKLLNKLKTQHADHKIPLVDDRNFIFDKQMCPMYRSLRASASSAPSAQQPVMSLAYSILTYNNVEQFERLLNLIHEPSNIYCIHVDQKASKTFKQAVESIVNCFDNVFVASQAENIVYAGYSRLKADVNCLGDLFNLDKLIDKHWNFMGKRNVPWKYFVNMASTEMPLRTNYELTRILDVYNGSNEVEIIKSISPNRIKYEWIEDKVEGKLTMTNKTKSAVPHGYKIVKGYAYCLLARRFVEYAIFDPKAKDLLEWSKDTWSPDEWFWATLHYNTKHFPHHGFKGTYFTTLNLTNFGSNRKS